MMKKVSVSLCAGLNDLDVQGEWLVQRQVLWRVPSELLQSRSGHRAKPRREQWSLIPEGEQEEVRDIFLSLTKKIQIQNFVCLSLHSW